MIDYHTTIARAEIENLEKWGDVADKIPSLKFKEDYEVKIIPPFAGAMARSVIEKNGERVCSVYCDFLDRLGVFGEPYYELYPFEDDIKRYSLDKAEEMMVDIQLLWELH